MGRAHLVLLALTLAGCAKQELPVHVRIESRFSERETERVLSVIAEANTTLGERIGHDVLVYDGRFTDEDGFSPEDFEDGVHGIHRLDTAPGYLKEVYGEEGKCAYATMQDVLLFADQLVPAGRDALRGSDFRSALLHELGHLLGMLHSPHPGDVMHRRSTALSFTENDKRQFCSIYGC